MGPAQNQQRAGAFSARAACQRARASGAESPVDALAQLSPIASNDDESYWNDHPHRDDDARRGDDNPYRHDDAYGYNDAHRDDGDDEPSRRHHNAHWNDEPYDHDNSFWWHHDSKHDHDPHRNYKPHLDWQSRTGGPERFFEGWRVGERASQWVGSVHRS